MTFAQGTAIRGFDAYVHAFRSGGGSLDAPHPVLVHVGHDPTIEARADYRTEMAEPAGLVARLAALRSASVANSPEKPDTSNDAWGYVFRIVKRAGGLYNTHIGVGRSTSVDVCLPFARLSKFHAYFVVDGGRLSIADASSKNGTWVEDVRLDPKRPTPLRDHTRVTFGGHQFVFLEPEGFLAAVKRGRLD